MSGLEIGKVFWEIATRGNTLQLKRGSSEGLPWLDAISILLDLWCWIALKTDPGIAVIVDPG